jgi:hypothetical protein
VPPRQTLTLLRRTAPESPVLPQDLYNLRAAIRRDLRQGQSPIDALLLYLENKGTYCRPLVSQPLDNSEASRLEGLFIACPESIEYLQSHHDVLLIDNTYSTNRFEMPLMDVIG